MRILMVNKFHYPRGGAEISHFLVANLMADAGHEIAHLSMRHPLNEPSLWSEYFLEEVSYEAAPWQSKAWKAVRRMFGGADVANAVRRIVADTSPDVAVLGNIYHQLGPATLMEELRRADIPMVQILHDFKIVCPSYLLLRNGRSCELCAHGRFHNAAKHGCGGSRSRGVLLAMEAYYQSHRWHHVDTFVAPSQFLIDQARKMGFPHPIRLIRNPVELEPSPPNGQGRTAVGFAGRLSREKGLGVLLEAARRLPQIPFRVAGRGPLENELEERCPPNLTLLGYLTPQTLAREMSAWRIAVVPSIWFENAPGTVLEAYSHAIPVVGSNHGGLAELLGYGGVGVKPADAGDLARAIEQLWGSPERCRRLGLKGLAFVETECSVERFSVVFQNLLRDVTS